MIFSSWSYEINVEGRELKLLHGRNKTTESDRAHGSAHVGYPLDNNKGKSSIKIRSTDYPRIGPVRLYILGNKTQKQSSFPLFIRVPG